MTSWRSGVPAGAMLLVLGSFASCTLLRDVDSLTSAPSGRGDEAGADAADDGASGARDGGDGPVASDSGCPGAAGPRGVRIGGDGGYCIDSTEVAVKHYRAFLAARAGDTSGQPAVCSWNTSFAPGSGGLPGPENDDEPVRSVDFCDAVAFCAWAGKRVCGAVGGGGLAFADLANASRSQWFRACSHNGDGLHSLPYGQSYEESSCNGPERDAGVAPVGSLPGCEGGYPGLFDMAGNVREWEDACDDGAGPTRRCLVRGGAFYDIRSTLECSNQQLVEVSEENLGFGFRCCGL